MSAEQLERRLLSPRSWSLHGVWGHCSLPVGRWERVLEIYTYSGLVLRYLRLGGIMSFLCTSDFPYMKWQDWDRFFFKVTSHAKFPKFHEHENLARIPGDPSGLAAAPTVQFIPAVTLSSSTEAAGAFAVLVMQLVMEVTGGLTIKAELFFNSLLSCLFVVVA